MKRRPEIRIGIPRLLNAYVYAPVFNAYFESLGLKGENIVYSDYTSSELYRAGASRGSRPSSCGPWLSCTSAGASSHE